MLRSFLQIVSLRKLILNAKLFLKKHKTVWSVQNLISAVALIIILCIGSYYRHLAIESNVRIRNGFEPAVSSASYLFKNPAASYQGSMVKQEHSIYDSFPLKEYGKYTDGAENFTFIRNPVINDSLNVTGKSRSELGWAFILRYVLPDGIKGSQNMAIRIVKFRFFIELILITLLFFTGRKVAGIPGAILAALLYAVFVPAIHMMTYITYYYWALSFTVFSLFFWIVLYVNVRVKKSMKKKIALFAFYGVVMGFASATRMIFLLLPLFLSPYILYEERRIRPTLILIAVMLGGQFLLLIPQAFVNEKQFGKFAITTRDTWHAVLTGVGMRKNPFGIVNSGDPAVIDYIKKATGVDCYKDGFDRYNKACKGQSIKIIKENPGIFINNARMNIWSARRINPSVFYGLDTPINSTPSLETIQKGNNMQSLISYVFIEKYFLWSVLLALILSFFGPHGMFRMFLLVLAHSVYLVLTICLYFPNYLYHLAGYIPAWVLLVAISLAIVLRQSSLYVSNLVQVAFRVGQRTVESKESS
jgi:hypothetical protein